MRTITPTTGWMPPRAGAAGSIAYVRALRAVFRHDAGAGMALLGAAVRPGVAASMAEDAGVFDEVSAHLTSGGECAYTDEGVAVDAGHGRLRLSGRRVPVLNGGRGSLLVAEVRDGGRSWLAVADGAGADRAGSGGAWTVRTSGAGCDVVDLTGAGVRTRAVLADPVLPYIVSSALVTGGAVGAVDSALRTVLRFALARELYGTTVACLPHARGVLAGACADLLVADSLVRTALAHAGIGTDGRDAGAATWAATRLLTGALRDLATVLGARFYLRTGPYAAFGGHWQGLSVLRALCGDPRRCVPGGFPDAATLGDLVGDDVPGLPPGVPAVSRLSDLDAEVRPPMAGDAADALMEDLTARLDDDLSLDLDRTSVSPGPVPSDDGE